MPSVLAVHKNVETVRRGYQAFNAGDLKALAELFDEKASWHSPGRSALAGSFKGRDAVFAHFGRLAQATNGTFRANFQHACADEEGRVIAMHRCTATRDGEDLEVDCCLVFEFRNGRIISGTEFVHDYPAWEAFWE